MDKEATNRQIVISEYDLTRLRQLVSRAKRDTRHLEELDAELSRALVVAPQEIPPNVITMNSTALLEDLDTGEEITLTLSFPDEANVQEGRISVLAPIGTAIIGFCKDDEIVWPVPAGERHLRVKDVVYQPESAGDFDL